MAIAVRLPDQLVNDAKKSAQRQFRSTPKQIEYYYQLGKIAEENPDLPVAFIRDILIARQEKSIKFEFDEE